MSFSKQKPAGWATNDPITPTQITNIDSNLADAYDKVGGEIITGNSSFEGAVEMAQSGSNAGSVAWRLGTLGDANAVIDVDYDIYIFTTAPTVARTFTLRHSTTPRPVAGNVIKVTMPMNSALAPAHFEREDTTEIARIPTSTYGAGVEFVFDGTDWQTLGSSNDGEYR